ncbi:MAG: phosphatase PAP2 family protein [Acidobacteria bacterium]|nr:MAG: phosphatase PAP2 family protein [Acidobacteriota bacterium]
MDAAALAVPGSWRVKGGRLLLDHAAAVTATSLTAGLKRATRRRRPDGSDRESFPSGHASRAFAYAAAGRVDLEESALPPGWRCALGAGLTALAAGTAWARVEAGVHFPTDVLAGAALGNFTARVMHERFAGRGREVSVAVDRRRGGWSVGVTLLWGAPPPR